MASIRLTSFRYQIISLSFEMYNRSFWAKINNVGRPKIKKWMFDHIFLNFGAAVDTRMKMTQHISDGPV